MPGTKEVQEALDEEAFKAEISRREAESAAEASAQAQVKMKEQEWAASQRVAARAKALVTPSSDGSDEVPTYAGLQTAASILSAFSIVAYIGGAIAFLFALVNIGSMAGIECAALLASGIGSLMSGAVLQGASAACEALRDIARNSFR